MWEVLSPRLSQCSASVGLELRVRIGSQGLDAVQVEVWFRTEWERVYCAVIIRCWALRPYPNIQSANRSTYIILFI